jgi:hypothetical protein
LEREKRVRVRRGVDRVPGTRSEVLEGLDIMMAIEISQANGDGGMERNE